MKNYNIKNNHRYDASKNTLTITTEFNKRVSLNTPEFNLIQEYRMKCPDMKIEIGTVEKQNKKSGKKHFTYEEMEKHLKDFYNLTIDGEKQREETISKAMKEFARIKMLSTLQKNPYKYVSDWFELKREMMEKQMDKLMEQEEQQEQDKYNIINFSDKQEEEAYKKAVNE